MANQICQVSIIFNPLILCDALFGLSSCLEVGHCRLLDFIVHDVQLVYLELRSLVYLIAFSIISCEQVSKRLDAVLTHVLGYLGCLSSSRLAAVFKVLDLVEECTDLEWFRVSVWAYSFQAHGVGHLCFNPIVQHINHLLRFFPSKEVEFFLLLVICKESGERRITSGIIVFRK